MRLLPLLQVEEVLIRKLTPAGSGEYEATQLTQITNLPVGLENGSVNRTDGKREREIAINTQFAWKNMFNRLMGGRDSAELVNWEVDPDVSDFTLCYLSPHWRLKDTDAWILDDAGSGQDHPCVQ